jgi:translation elongation factor EF-Tu-like GTPase
MVTKPEHETPTERAPDVEALFEFNGVRAHAAHDGYRPQHLVNDTYLTSGVHHYYGTAQAAPNTTAKGTITFISPEAYPHCLWVGKRISIQEGTKVVGCAVITKIFNPLLGPEK